MKERVGIRRLNPSKDHIPFIAVSGGFLAGEREFKHMVRPFNSLFFKK